jgi:hypothetical protein
LEEFRKEAETRYELEPFKSSFANFEAERGNRVLEIGVGLGADHRWFAEAGAFLMGIDLFPGHRNDAAESQQVGAEE